MGDLVAIIQTGASALARLRALPSTSNAETVAASAVELLAPIQRFSRDVLCTGWNYWDHFYESAGKREGQDVPKPDAPTFFTKAPGVVIAPGADIAFDERISAKWDYEAEIAVIASEQFYGKALGLRTSDRAAGKVAFMAAGEGVRDHHCFGLIKSTHRGFQHGSFHVNSIDDIGFGALQMHQAGYREGFGVGRHALASNLFHYTRDPWGSWIGYYTDMDKISEAWQAQDWNALPYVWPQWAPEFWVQEMNANQEPR